MDSTSSSSESSHAEISARAREMWLNAGSPPDRDVEFWLAAEAELRNARAQTQETVSRPPVKRAARENRKRV